MIPLCAGGKYLDESRGVVTFSERINTRGCRMLPRTTRDWGLSARNTLPAVQKHNPWLVGEGGVPIAYLQIRNLNLNRSRIVQPWGNRMGPMADRVIPLPEGARRS